MDFFNCKNRNDAEIKARGLRDSGYNTEIALVRAIYIVRGSLKNARQMSGEEIKKKKGQPRKVGPTPGEIEETEQWASNL